MINFSEQEKWICILTVFKTAKNSKNLPLKVRQSLEEILRKKYCPNIDYPQWLEIEKNIIQLSKDIQKTTLELIMKSMGKKTFEGDELDQVRHLEEEVQKSGMQANKEIINMIKTFSPDGKPEVSEMINELVDQIEKKQ